jgi:carbonic anhydrase
LLEATPTSKRHDALVELNVVEQVVNVCQSTVMLDAWARGQKVQVHGWVYGVHDGLLQDLGMSVNGVDGLEPLYRAAIHKISSTDRQK